MEMRDRYDLFRAGDASVFQVNKNDRSSLYMIKFKGWRQKEIEGLHWVTIIYTLIKQEETTTIQLPWNLEEKY